MATGYTHLKDAEREHVLPGFLKSGFHKIITMGKECPDGGDSPEHALEVKNSDDHKDYKSGMQLELLHPYPQSVG
jgi:hypothetical protein